MAITGDPAGDPMKVGIALADIVAGKDATIAILAALAARGRDPSPRPAEARRLFVSLAQSAAAALVNVAQNALISGQEAKRWGNAHANLVPYQLFAAADRALVIAVGSDAQWQACARALDLPALADDPDLATNAGRLARLDSAAVPAGRVKSVLEVLGEVEASPLTGVAPSVPGSVRLPPPRLGEHGADIRKRGWGAFD